MRSLVNCFVRKLERRLNVFALKRNLRPGDKYGCQLLMAIGSAKHGHGAGTQFVGLRQPILQECAATESVFDLRQQQRVARIGNLLGLAVGEQSSVDVTAQQS